MKLIQLHEIDHDKAAYLGTLAKSQCSYESLHWTNINESRLSYITFNNIGSMTQLCTNLSTSKKKSNGL